MRKTEEILFDLLKVSLFDAKIDATIIQTATETDWREVRSIAERQGISAVVFDSLDKLKKQGIIINMSLDDLMDWLGQTSYVETTYAQQLEDSSALAELWSRHGIRTMVFKGLALSQYYPVPAHREFGDFDCYLFGKYDGGNIVAKQAGCKVNTGWYKHSQIHFKGVMAENHKYFTQCRKGQKERELNKDLVGSLGDGTFLERLNGTSLLLPPLSFEGLFLVYHAMAHFLLEGLTIRHLCDWACWMYANQNKISWRAFYAQCKQYGFETFVDALNSISAEYLGLKITNKDIILDNSYVTKILENTLYEDSKIYNKGKSRWYERVHLITNAFRYSWKYREVAHYSMMGYLWSYVRGFIFRNEED